MTGRRRLGVFTLAAGLLAAPVRAQDPDDAAPAAAPAVRTPRFSAFVGGGVALGNASFEGQRRFTEYAEEGSLDADYARGSGPGFEVGLDYAVGRHFDIGLRFNAVSRDASGDYEAALPHPLFLERPRRASGTVDALSYSERAFHLQLGYRMGTGRWRLGVFAGPTYGSVTSELVDRVQYQQTYPFDEVQVTTLNSGRYTGKGFGFNVGAETDYRLGGRAAAALLVRYHRLSPDLPDSAGTVEIDAGGLQVGAGIRFFLR